MVEQINERYQLRHAAGVYWLLDMWQDGGKDKKPIVFNETGAQIWKMLQAGVSTDEIVAYFEMTYGVSAEQATEDVLLYIQMLKEQGILQ